MHEYGLRIVSGAPGFMSKVSKWLGPPHWNKKITDFARGLIALGSSTARNSLGIDSPNIPSPPTFNKWRRTSSIVFLFALSQFRHVSLFMLRRGHPYRIRVSLGVHRKLDMIPFA